MTLPPNEIYARLLFAEGQGLPLWDPSLDANSPQQYQQHGIQVGDVGYHSRDGRFIFLFNISLPKEHPINIWRGNLPDSFEPITLGIPDSRPGAYPPPSVFLHTNSGKMSFEGTAEANVPKTPLDAAFSFGHQSDHSQGAALVLRNGASNINYDLDLSDWAGRKARFCYEYAASLGYSIPNGGIYLVTGVAKTNNWHISTFSKSSGGNFASFKISVAGVLSGKITGSESIQESSLHTPRHSPPDHCVQNQTVFIRGWKMMLSKQLWKNLKIKPRAKLIDIQYSKFDKVKLLGPIICPPEASNRIPEREPVLTATLSSDSTTVTQTPLELGGIRDHGPSTDLTCITDGEESTQGRKASSDSSSDFETSTTKKAHINKARKKKKKKVPRGGNSHHKRDDDPSGGGSGQGCGGKGGHANGDSDEGGGRGSRRQSGNNNGQNGNPRSSERYTQFRRRFAGGQPGEEREEHSDHGENTSSELELQGTSSHSSEDFEPLHQPYHPSDVINRFLLEEVKTQSNLYNTIVYS
ncbi:hypothetical protein CVT26_010003 [Gymnopilus dilepis]|uniref:Uncharacterized protein n=1 Tax=Gymnopilus dilepis TaxID=231916 RepID=A0A409WTH1_9AGAR|nr:hypothetical protein CVT26_010003 [Gymnopilus dilepis]